MGTKLHKLKIECCFFNDVAQGFKTFELRRMDRDYEVGDFLELYEYEGGAFTGRSLVVRVTYMLYNILGYGLESGYGILGIALSG